MGVLLRALKTGVVVVQGKCQGLVFSGNVSSRLCCLRR